MEDKAHYILLGRKILITGGTGSFGNVAARRLLSSPGVSEVYDFTDKESILDFFSSNYDDEMVRAVHGTKILSFSLKQREE
jgi:FlaA1/EpsC-like NDP-sugar epimerase